MDETEETTNAEFVELLLAAASAGDEELSERVRYARSFDEAGLLTSNSGVVVTLDDGSEFQVTVVRSR